MSTINYYLFYYITNPLAKKDANQYMKRKRFSALNSRIRLMIEKTSSKRIEATIDEPPLGPYPVFRAGYSRKENAVMDSNINTSKTATSLIFVCLLFIYATLSIYSLTIFLINSITGVISLIVTA